ncbi:Centriole, cilia and spindle-associated protein [Sciurus carolinensis]|uniref:Centriole, cilia and spindle-associated protein n=1 Tax=Sciurus carolinensis TaxID=30640 RepID=A0AA41T4Q0_SCICA|nr:Centriole, cilia and spindle-associated protein [Sciurus carolinensis]
MDTGSQKTHNVCASASVHEIHEFALRAKSRRQVEKRKLAAQRQRAHWAEVEKSRASRAHPAESPWVTEYMRCYSALAMTRRPAPGPDQPSWTWLRPPSGRERPEAVVWMEFVTYLSRRAEGQSHRHQSFTKTNPSLWYSCESCV